MAIFWLVLSIILFIVSISIAFKLGTNYGLMERSLNTHDLPRDGRKLLEALREEKSSKERARVLEKELIFWVDTYLKFNSLLRTGGLTRTKEVEAWLAELNNNPLYLGCERHLRDELEDMVRGGFAYPYTDMTKSDVEAQILEMLHTAKFVREGNGQRVLGFVTNKDAETNGVTSVGIVVEVVNG